MITLDNRRYRPIFAVFGFLIIIYFGEQRVSLVLRQPEWAQAKCVVHTNKPTKPTLLVCGHSSSISGFVMAAIQRHLENGCTYEVNTLFMIFIDNVLKFQESTSTSSSEIYTPRPMGTGGARPKVPSKKKSQKKPGRRGRTYKDISEEDKRRLKEMYEERVEEAEVCLHKIPVMQFLLHNHYSSLLL